MTVVADSSPLIYLAALSDFNFLNELFGRIIVPPAVFEELVTYGDGHAVQEAMRTFVGDWIDRQELRDSTLRNRLMEVDALQASESEVISLAVEAGAVVVLMDERDAIACARGLGLHVVSTPILYKVAKSRGWIRSVREKLDALCAAGFRVDDSDYLEISKSLGEI